MDTEKIELDISKYNNIMEKTSQLLETILNDISHIKSSLAKLEKNGKIDHDTALVIREEVALTRQQNADISCKLDELLNIGINAPAAPKPRAKKAEPISRTPSQAIINPDDETVEEKSDEKVEEPAEEKVDAPVAKPNIQILFKNLYKNDIETLYTIISKADVEKVFKANSEEIAGKPNPDTYKCQLLYKSLNVGQKKQLTKLKG